jgi:hypothetical protein
MVMKLLCKILFLCSFVMPNLSCRKIMNFFSPEGKREEEPAAVVSGNPCADKELGWMWIDKECINIDAHLVASAVAYVRILGLVNQDMFRQEPKRENKFRILLTDSVDHLYKAIRESGRESFETWLRSIQPTWEKAREPSIPKAYEVSYRLSYDHVVKEGAIGLSRLATGVGRHFFEIIQTEKMEDYPFRDRIYRNALADAENSFAIAASDWNHHLNQDEALKKEFETKMTILIGQIMQSRVRD